MNLFGYVKGSTFYQYKKMFSEYAKCQSSLVREHVYLEPIFYVVSYFPFIVTICAFIVSWITKDVLMLYFTYISKLLWFFNMGLKGIIYSPLIHPECKKYDFDVFYLSFPTSRPLTYQNGMPSIDGAQIGLILAFFVYFRSRPWNAATSAFAVLLLVSPSALWAFEMETAAQIWGGFFWGMIVAFSSCYWLDKYFFPVWLCKWLDFCRQNQNTYVTIGVTLFGGADRYGVINKK